MSVVCGDGGVCGDGVDVRKSDFDRRGIGFVGEGYLRLVGGERKKEKRERKTGLAFNNGSRSDARQR